MAQGIDFSQDKYRAQPTPVQQRREQKDVSDIRQSDASSSSSEANAARTRALTPEELEQLRLENARRRRDLDTPPLVPGQEKQDQDFAVIANKWSSERPNIRRQIQELQTAIQTMQGSDSVSGPLISMVPEGIRTRVAPESKTVKDAVENAIRLKDQLDSQFAAKEAAQVYSRRFDPILEEGENLKRAQELLDSLLDTFAERESQVKYWRGVNPRTGTTRASLRGWSSEDVADIRGSIMSQAEQADAGRAFTPEREQQLRAYIDSPDFTPEGYADLSEKLTRESGLEPGQDYREQALRLGKEIQEGKARGDVFGPGLRYVSPEEKAPETPVSSAEPSGLGRAWDVGSGAVANFVPDLGRVVWDTAKGMWDLSGQSELGGVAGRWLPQASVPRAMSDTLGKLGSSILAKAGIGNASPQLADAVGAFYAQRYGSSDAALNTLRDHPAEVLMDLSTVFTGGETLAPRLAAQAGKVSRLSNTAANIARAGEMSGVAARATDPIRLATELPVLVSKYIPDNAKLAAANLATKYPSEVVGLPSGVGGENVRTGMSVGRERSVAGKSPRTEAFWGHFTGKAPVEDIVTELETGVQRLRDKASAQYEADMAAVKADPTILNFDGIDAALADLQSRAYYRDTVRDPAAARAFGDIKSIVEEWRGLPPDQFHTPEGMDALKQRIAGVEGGYQTENNRRAASVAAGVRKAVTDEITAQAPTYAKAMENYSSAKDLLANIRNTLDSGKGRVDSTVRRLQGILKRDDPGYGGKLLDVADEGPENNLRAALAGRAGEPIRPERYRAAVAGGMGLASLPVEAALSALLGRGSEVALALDPSYLAGMAMMSPKVTMGGSYATGRAAGLAELAAKGGYDAYTTSPTFGRLGVNATSTSERVRDDMLEQSRVPVPSLQDLASRYPQAPMNAAPDQIVTPDYGGAAPPAAQVPGLPPGWSKDPVTGDLIAPDGTHHPVMVSPVTGR